MLRKVECGICWLVRGLSEEQRRSAAFSAWEEAHPDFQPWSDEDFERQFRKNGFVLLYLLPRDAEPEQTYFLKQEACRKFCERYEASASGIAKASERGFVKLSAWRPGEAEFADEGEFQEALERYLGTLRKLQPPGLGDAAEEGFLFFPGFAEARKALPGIEMAMKSLEAKR